MTGSRPVRLGRRNLLLVDGVLALAVVPAAGWGITAATPVATGFGWVVATALGLPVAARRRYPVPALYCAAAATVVALVVGLRPDVAVLSLALAAYPAALTAGPGRPARSAALLLAAVPVVGLAGGLLVPRAVTAAAPAGGPVVTLVYGWLILGAGWALARAVRARRVHAAEVVELREREAATAERLRIAREVHDVVGHSLAVIAARAGIADHVAATRPDEGRAALSDIATLSREALAQVRAVMVAPDERSACSGGPVRTIERLVDGARDAGVPVELSCPDLATVAAPVRESAGRIVQEALTNVLRHTTGPSRCRVTLEIDDAELRVGIVDDGPARSPVTAPGHGLRNIRDRVAQHGGTVVLGPRDVGGFEVRARLPLLAPHSRA